MDAIEPVPGGEPADGGDVGAFRQGTAASQWALARYLVGRAVAEAMSRGLLVVALVLLAGAAAIWSAGSVFWGVVVGLVALALVIMRRLILAIVRRLPLVAGDPVLDARLGELVAATRKDVLAELRRVGLPGRTWSVPLLAVRLVGRHRTVTAERLRGFDVDRVVPAARLDEVHLLLQSAGRRATG